MFELTAIIQGRVQGVGFRATTKLFAEHLKLTGYVRNLPDGNVELCAQGEKFQIESLLSELRREFSSYIKEIKSDFHPTSQIYADFRIVR